jgi:hypothetical protein
MHRLEALIAGVRGAENGTVDLYLRGTSTVATYYTDFEGTASASGAAIPLDANGGAVVFVNALVRVVVKSALGATVREYVAGDAAPAVELRSLSATGAAYVGGALAPGNPTTVKAWADSWIASAGAPDFQVLFGGVATDLDTALAAVAGLRYYIITDPTYGAVGDGLTNDLAAIQAAINAANAAGGGVVFIPKGTFLVNGTLTGYSTVSFLGYSRDLSTIEVASGSASLMTGAAPAGFARISFTISGATYSGQMFNFSSGGESIVFDDISSSGDITGTWFNYSYGGIAQLEMTVRNSQIVVASNGVVTAGAYLFQTWETSAVVAGLAGAASGSLISSNSGIIIRDLIINVSGGTSGTKNLIDCPVVVSSGLIGSMGIAGTVIVFYTGSAAGRLRESGTSLTRQATTTLVMYSGFPGSFYMNGSEDYAGTLVFGSRGTASVRVSGDTDPCVITADQARHVTARVTSTAGWTGNCNVNINLAPRGADVIVSFWNDTGAPVTFVWGTNVSITAATTFAVAANSFRTFLLVSDANYPTSDVLEWFLVSDVAGAEVIA